MNDTSKNPSLLVASLFVALLCISLVPISAIAQSSTASIAGVVSVPTGEAIPNARITAIDTAKGVNYNTVSSSTGTYSLPVLPVGEYSLHVEAPGYKTAQRTGLT